MLLYEKFANDLHKIANESPIKFPIAAVLIENRRMVSRIRNNTDRSSFHGAVHSSLHAEMNTILDFYGNKIRWDKCMRVWKCGDGKSGGGSKGKDRFWS
jgi:tRNA(Arg) A34 adenosine deaminase TadA